MDPAAALAAIISARQQFELTKISYAAWLAKAYKGEPGAPATIGLRSNTPWFKGLAALDVAQDALADQPDPDPTPLPPIVVPSGTATILFRGRRLEPADKPPLIVAMGHTGPPGFQKQTLWMEAADRKGLAVAIPNGQDGWVGYPAHLAWLKAQIPAWLSQLNADPNRVYLTGFSAGASFALWVANEGSLPLAGVAPVSGWLNKTASPTMQRRPPCRLLQFMGTKDAQPYDGTNSVLFSLRDVSQKFAALNGAPSPQQAPATVSLTGAWTESVWTQDVVEYLGKDGTHLWPGGPGVTGPDAQVDATSLISQWALA